MQFENYWKEINSLEFNCFKFDEISKGKGLSLLLNFLFHSQNLCTKLSIQEKVLTNFSTKIQEGYQNNPYHNRIHAFDVCQVNFFHHSFLVSIKPT